jgi:hypothetical protein
MTEITFTIERGDEELELTITGHCTKYVPANFRGHPDNWAPAEGGDSEIEEILRDDGKPWSGKLTDIETKEAERALYEQAERDAEDAATDAAVSQYEDSLDRWD